MSAYLGDIAPSQVLYFGWSSNGADGASITRATNGTVSVYKDDGTTQSTTGVTDTEDFDSLTGVHWVKIDTSADGTFYAAGHDYTVVLSGATIDGKTVNAVLGFFSINNRTALRPTTAGRTLDVSSGGEAGVDWANVGSPTTTLDLSGTTIKTTQKVDVETIKTQSVTCAAGVTVLAQVGAAAAPGTNGGLATVDASNRIAGVQGTKHTLDDLNDLSAAGVRSAVGLASANLDTQIATLATLTKLLKYVQLLARKDAAIATDNATELTAINANGGSGAGGYDNTTDAQEALRDRGDAAWTTVAAAAIRSAVGLASANLDTQLGTLATPAQVKTQVVDALATDTYAEPAQGAPPATTTIAVKINYLYKNWRNRKLQTSTEWRLLSDDAVTVDHKAAVADDGTTASKGEVAAGP